MNLGSKLSSEGQKIFKSRLITKSFYPGQRILDKGDSVSGAYFVLEGQLRVYTLSQNGKEATLYNIAPGETCILALNSMFNDFLYPAWVVAEGETSVGVLPGQVYRDLFRTEPTIQDITIKALSATVFGLMSQLEQQHIQTVKQRLAGYLILRSSSDFIIQTTQQKIAHDLGSSREFIARTLSDFNEMGIIKSGRGKILILDFERLKQLREQGDCP